MVTEFEVVVLGMMDGDGIIDGVKKSFSGNT